MASCYLCESAEGVIEHRNKMICVRCYNFPIDIAFSLKMDLESLGKEAGDKDKNGEEELKEVSSPPVIKPKGGKE